MLSQWAKHALSVNLSKVFICIPRDDAFSSFISSDLLHMYILLCFLLCHFLLAVATGDGIVNEVHGHANTDYQLQQHRYRVV